MYTYIYIRRRRRKAIAPWKWGTLLIWSLYFCFMMKASKSRGSLTSFNFHTFTTFRISWSEKHIYIGRREKSRRAMKMRDPFSYHLCICFMEVQKMWQQMVAWGLMQMSFLIKHNNLQTPDFFSLASFENTVQEVYDFDVLRLEGQREKPSRHEIDFLRLEG